MKHSLQLNLGQHLTMTPQLQQAIRLLQLSALELQTEVQEMLDSNPLLEPDEVVEHKDTQKDSPSNSDSQQNETKALDQSEQVGTQNDIPDELSVDSGWEDVYGDATPAPKSSSSDDYTFQDMLGQKAPAEGLKEHLQWQVELSRFFGYDQTIAEAIVDSINEDGYLATTTEDLLSSLVKDNEEIELDEVEAVLTRVQSFDPPGVGARNPQECLLIQLRQLPEDTKYLDSAIKIISIHMNLMATRDFNQIKRRMKLSDEVLKKTIELIRSLNPRPGGQIEKDQTQYVVPDIYVKKESNIWTVKLNNESSPKLKINSEYSGLIKRADSSADNTYLKNHLQEAKWFLKSLQSRNETLFKVATTIVQKQIAFFENGDEAMKPMVLRDVAEILEMHESTISRVTNQKYMHTPRGIFEFKYFFSSHVSTDSGGECSATAIRALIKKLVAAEKPEKPLSDSKIAALLADQGIKVARRTIAKYRESMSIPPSNERKRLI